MQSLSFSFAFFAAIFGVFSFAALYARNVGQVFGLTFDRLANPVFSFGAMIAVLAVANTFVPPLVPTVGIMLAIAAAAMVAMIIMQRRNATKPSTMFELVTNIFLGSSGLLMMTHSPVSGTLFGIAAPVMTTVLIAALIALISLRPPMPIGTKA